MNAVLRAEAGTTRHAGEVPAPTTFSRAVNSTGCRPAPQLHELSAADLERLIRGAGEQMVAWYDFDREVARHWLRRMDALIAQRSPQHQAAMEQAIRSRIEDPCYFSSDAAHSLTGGVR